MATAGSPRTAFNRGRSPSAISTTARAGSSHKASPIRSNSAIVGWSYGGYAALQANVVDPRLYRAAVAVAPVTDLAMLKENARIFTDGPFIEAMVGSGPHITPGSPARRAAEIRVPVLMFSGDKDANVDIAQSRAMDVALRGAHRSHELIVYPGLDHQLDDSGARADLLRRSAAFLAAALRGETPATEKSSLGVLDR